jgi:CRP/FNR family cyclic AMP-dependent transcriptional regulator
MPSVAHTAGVNIRAVFLNAHQHRTLADGEQLFAAGDPGHEMYGIVAGHVELHQDGVLVRRLDEGDTFGEMALIDGSPRSMTAVASGPTEVAVIDEKAFLFLVHETPLFALQVMRSVAARLRANDHQPH